jgi:uncharacterized glyoxalase superfamily metalloenzyme YdcJ
MTPHPSFKALAELQPLFAEWDAAAFRLSETQRKGFALIERHKKLAREIDRLNRRGQDVTAKVAELRQVFTEYAAMFSEVSQAAAKLAEAAPVIADELNFLTQ